MKKYWIILDGQPRGPYTPQEIAGMGVATPSLRVWHKGLPEWVALSSVPELASILTPGAEAEAEADSTVVEETEAVEVTEVITEAETPAAEEKEETTAGSGERFAPQASWGAAATVSPAAPSRPAPGSRMPATYLPWNILATICCCLPAGIAGIIFSSRVSKKFYEGDMAGARRASEAAAWCLMLSIVLGLVGWPFQMLFSGV